MDIHPRTPRLALALAAGLFAAMTPAVARADMLSGGFLGSILRGDEFTGPRLIDLLVIGLGMFLVLRLILGRPGKSPDQHQPPETPPYDELPPEEPPATPPAKPNMYTNAQAAWASLKSPTPKNAGPETSPADTAPPGASPDEEFLAGAKMAYTRITGAIANRDFDDLAGFATPAFLNQLKNTLPASPPPQPAVLLVEATLAARHEEGHTTIMVVDYQILIHEADAPHNTDRTEQWRFVRDNNIKGANWLLDGMQ